MFDLPGKELVLFLVVVILYLAAAIIGVVQLLEGGARYRRFLTPLLSIAIIGEVVILVFRAAAIKAIPLTGLFESMLVLTVAFGVVYLCFSLVIEQVWFGSIMAWVILGMVLVAAVTATPASEPSPAAATPWAIAHGTVMTLGAASVTFSAATAVLYLLGMRKLKQKQVMQVLGRVPNIEKLERLSLLGVRVGFLFITIGLVSGLGLAKVTGTGLAGWLLDAKVISIILAWLVLAGLLVLNHTLLLKGRARAYLILAAFLLIAFAILGVATLGTTQHNFSNGSAAMLVDTGYEII